jgi:hypothetical protein
MPLLIESFGRALAYCLMPQVIGLSLLPLCLLVVGSGLGIYFFWDLAVSQLQEMMADWTLLARLFNWFDALGAQYLRSVMAPLGLLILTLPVIIVVSLLTVSWFMTPAIVKLVSKRRFSGLQRLKGGSFFKGFVLSLGLTFITLLALVISMPLWLLPPLMLVLPPVLWGWLAYRINTYDVLADHASEAERELLMRRHRYSLLTMGLFTGFLGATPGLIWTVGAMAVVFAPLLLPLAVWIYTLVFAFSVLWFAHFGLAALQVLRAQNASSAQIYEPDDQTLPLLPHDHHI